MNHFDLYAAMLAFMLVNCLVVIFAMLSWWACNG